MQKQLPSLFYKTAISDKNKKIIIKITSKMLGYVHSSVCHKKIILFDGRTNYLENCLLSPAAFFPYGLSAEKA